MMNNITTNNIIQLKSYNEDSWTIFTVDTNLRYRFGANKEFEQVINF